MAGNAGRLWFDDEGHLNQSGTVPLSSLLDAVGDQLGLFLKRLEACEKTPDGLYRLRDAHAGHLGGVRVLWDNVTMLVLAATSRTLPPMTPSQRDRFEKDGIAVAVTGPPRNFQPLADVLRQLTFAIPYNADGSWVAEVPAATVDKLQRLAEELPLHRDGIARTERIMDNDGPDGQGQQSSELNTAYERLCNQTREEWRVIARKYAIECADGLDMLADRWGTDGDTDLIRQAAAKCHALAFSFDARFAPVPRDPAWAAAIETGLKASGVPDDQARESATKGLFGRFTLDRAVDTPEDFVLSSNAQAVIRAVKPLVLGGTVAADLAETCKRLAARLRKDHDLEPELFPDKQQATANLPELKPHDRQAWQLSLLDGMTQTRVAETLNREHGTTYGQGHISRMIKRAKAHADASGLTALLSDRADRPRSVDPARLELGARTDKRTPRPSDLARADDHDE